MNEIKFSHYYTKFDDINIDKPVRLLAVFNEHKDNLSGEFLVYDTRHYPDDGEKEGFEYYTLASMPVLVLVFSNNYNIFTTIRRWTEQKETYYRTAIGEEFKIKIQT